MKNKTEQNNHIALLEIEANNYMRKETSLSPKSIKNYTQAIRKVATDLANIYGAEKSKELRTCTGDKLDIIGAHYFMIEKNRSQNKRAKICIGVAGKRSSIVGALMKQNKRVKR